MSTNATRTSPAPDGVTADPDATASPPSDADATASPTHGPPPPHPHDPPPGFEFVSWIARGGMGVVYLARQIGLNRLCAIKVVAAADGKSLIRFLAEAELVAAIRHPNVVEVYQYGEHGGHPYLALEYCPGGDLSHLVNREAKTSAAGDFRRVAELMAQVADGVQAAHQLGIIHRDLKPGNVLLGNPPGEPAASAVAPGEPAVSTAWVPKVADFGLAKRGAGSDLTRTQAIMGTPAYMSPEQASGGTKFVGPESDVWALGVMLYELTSGQRPFTGDGPMEVLAAVTKGDFSPLQKVCPTVPRDLALIVTKCLQRDAKDRYPTAGPLATDLRNWLAGKPISARPAGVIEQAVKWANRNKRLAVMGAAVLLTMATATGVSLGFGLEADAQRRTAVRTAERLDEEVGKSNLAAADAEREKKVALTAGDRLTEANVRTQRTLAKALLGPISATARDTWGDRLSEYERDALWQLVELRNGPVGGFLLTEASASVLTSKQLSSRAEFLFHSAIGLDSKAAAKMNERVVSQLGNLEVADELKRNIAMSAVHAEQFTSAIPEIVQALLDAFTKDPDYRDQDELGRLLAILAPRLPANAIPEIVQTLLDAFIKNPTYRGKDAFVRVLAILAPRLPATKAEGVCVRVVDHIDNILARSNSWGTGLGGESAVVLAMLADYLPATKAKIVYSRAADSLILSLSDPTESKYNWVTLAKGLAAVTSHLPASQAEAYCDKAADTLLAALNQSASFYDQKIFLDALAVIGRGISSPKANSVAEVVVSRLVKADRGVEQKASAGVLGVVGTRLPPDKAAAVCSNSASNLLSELGKVSPSSSWDELAQSLASVADRLPADKTHDVCSRAADILLTQLGKEKKVDTRRRLAEGLASLASRLPADYAVNVFHELGERVVADPNEALKWYGAEVLVAAPMAATVRLPADEAAEVRWKSASALLSSLDTADSGGERRRLAKRLAGVTCGINLHEAHLLNIAPHVGSVVGCVTLHPDVLPKPRPLPPQRLVELLKHPFCVREARRAVLDALEFTYDRKFADLWEFVAFAEKEHPELDLLTPPKRPTK
jgi:hypothetical protein